MQGQKHDAHHIRGNAATAVLSPRANGPDRDSKGACALDRRWPIWCSIQRNGIGASRTAPTPDQRIPSSPVLSRFLGCSLIPTDSFNQGAMFEVSENLGCVQASLRISPETAGYPVTNSSYRSGCGKLFRR